MSTNEACQVWIEQRIQEELSVPGNKSLREISRTVMAEITKMFETDVPETTILHKVRKIKKNIDGIQSAPANQGSETVKAGHTGHKTTPQKIVEEVEKRVKKGKSIREAAQEIADEHGKKQSAVREAYRREKEKSQYQCTATKAVSFAQMAIFQLERITKDDEKWEEALLVVETWITEFRSKK